MKTALDLVNHAKAGIQECSSDYANQQLSTQKLIVIDVREPDEYKQGHLPGALNIPRGLLEFRLSATPTLDNRQQGFLVYCKTSGRSALATQTMQNMGYQQVTSLAGGFDAWQEQGFTVIQPALLNEA